MEGNHQTPKSAPSYAGQLRAQAEEIVRKTENTLKNLSYDQVQELVEELRIHHIELELQNESLQETQCALENARDQFASLYNTAPVGYISSDMFGKISKTNQTMADMLQVNCGQLVGTDLNQWCAESDAFYLHCRTLAGRGTRLKKDMELKRENGECFFVSVNSVLMDADSNGNREIRSVVTDISDRKELEQQLHHAQKMESVGRLAGGVAHDYNNMLSVIIGNVEIAMNEAADNALLHELLTDICAAAMRSADVTQQLLAFASKQTISPKILDLNQTITKMLKMIYRLIGEQITLSFEPGADLWQVKMDPTQVDQILANLCVNAKDAISGIGNIDIKTENVAFEESFCSIHPSFQPGEFVMLQVRDNGCGMDAETRQNLFEPFYTTKGIHKGTGLGLATVYGIVKQNNGFIIVHSRPGQGASFEIYLPRNVSRLPRIPDSKITRTITKGTGTVLLVEDEGAVLKMTMRMLEDLGYRVLGSGSPQDAITLARTCGTNIDVLIADVVMPEMNGKDLADILHRMYPEMKQLFMSGYAAEIIAHQGVLTHGVAFLEKPFSFHDLSKKMSDIL